MKVDIKLLGMFSLKTEDMKFWQLLIVIFIGATIMIAAIYWLKLYVLPVFGTQGISSLIQTLRNRSP